LLLETLFFSFVPYSALML